MVLTMDFALLKPYFHGTTTRIGAPFWFGKDSPYIPCGNRWRVWMLTQQGSFSAR